MTLLILSNLEWSQIITKIDIIIIIVFNGLTTLYLPRYRKTSSMLEGERELRAQAQILALVLSGFGIAIICWALISTALKRRRWQCKCHKVSVRIHWDGVFKYSIRAFIKYIILRLLKGLPSHFHWGMWLMSSHKLRYRWWQVADKF